MIELTIPELLPSMNRMQIGAHWSAWRSEKKRWNQWVMIAKHNQARMAGINPRYERARLVIERHCVQDCKDAENLRAGTKWLMDALVLHGLLKDDSMAVVGTPEIRQIRCKRGRQQTVVRIYPENAA